MPTGRERGRLTWLLNTFVMTDDKLWHATFLQPWDKLTFLNRKSLTQRRAEARPDRVVIRRGGQRHIRDKEPINHLPNDLWALPVNPWVNQPSPTSIPWQSISYFPNCFFWLPLTAQQPTSTLIRRVKSPLNDGWICGVSRFCRVLSILKPLEKHHDTITVANHWLLIH